MYVTGDFIISGQQFNADSWGTTTAQFMDYVVKDLKEKHWEAFFIALASFSVQAEEATHDSAPAKSYECTPLPPSDPPSPACDD